MKPQVIRPDPAGEYLTEERCHILEMSNSADDQQASVAQARVAPGKTTALHRLQDTVERYVILKGQGRVEISGQSSDVQPGDIVIIPAALTQRITNTGNDDLVFLCVCTPRFRQENYEDLEATE